MSTEGAAAAAGRLPTGSGLAALGAASPVDALAWQPRLRAIRDASRALVYLHASSNGKPVVLHRDVKPANMLLDAQLNCKLGDVGLARASAALNPGGGQTHLSTRRLLGTPGFIDPLYTETGQYSQLTDGYALGISLLMCLSGRPAVDGDSVSVFDAWADVLEAPSAETLAPLLDEAAGWPADVALALVHVVIGLSWRRTRSRRMALNEALQQFEAAADSSGVRPGLNVVVEERECVICLSEPRDTRFGCGHSVCCGSCASRLRAQGARVGVCPVCRLPIHRIADRGSHLALAPTFEDVAHV